MAMYLEIHPKLPMRNRSVTRQYYVEQLGFTQFGGDYPDYLMLAKDNIQLHFFLFRDLNPLENYGQVYIRTEQIDELYQMARDKDLPMPTLGDLETRPWGQREFSLLDPDHNLLTFGQSVM